MSRNFRRKVGLFRNLRQFMNRFQRNRYCNAKLTECKCLFTLNIHHQLSAYLIACILFVCCFSAASQLLVSCFNSNCFFPICVSFHHRPNFYRCQRTETAVITKSVTFNRVGVTSHKSVTYRFIYRNGLQVTYHRFILLQL